MNKNFKPNHFYASINGSKSSFRCSECAFRTFIVLLLESIYDKTIRFHLYRQDITLCLHCKLMLRRSTERSQGCHQEDSKDVCFSHVYVILLFRFVIIILLKYRKGASRTYDTPSQIYGIKSRSDLVFLLQWDDRKAEALVTIVDAVFLQRPCAP